jgi:hypothetical protein
MNEGYNYALCGLDVFSRYAWAVPIKTKKPGDIAQGVTGIANVSAIINSIATTMMIINPAQTDMVQTQGARFAVVATVMIAIKTIDIEGQQAVVIDHRHRLIEKKTFLILTLMKAQTYA